jgi:hypothetical protein
VIPRWERPANPATEFATERDSMDRDAQGVRNVLGPRKARQPATFRRCLGCTETGSSRITKPLHCHRANPVFQFSATFGERGRDKSRIDIGMPTEFWRWGYDEDAARAPEACSFGPTACVTTVAHRPSSFRMSSPLISKRFSAASVRSGM